MINFCVVGLVANLCIRPVNCGSTMLLQIVGGEIIKMNRRYELLRLRCKLTSELFLLGVKVRMQQGIIGSRM